MREPTIYGLCALCLFTGVLFGQDAGHCDRQVAPEKTLVDSATTSRPSFQQRSVQVKQRPHMATTGDFNGDCVLDVVTANGGDATLSLLLGDESERRFANPVHLEIPRAFLHWIDGTDLDGDDAPDLVSVHFNADRLQVLLNDGDGEFGAATPYPVGRGPFMVTTARLDDNESVDLLSANVTARTISLLLNRNDGSFAEAIDVPVGTAPRAIATADLDGDADLDIAVVNQVSRDLSLIWNLGGGEFSEAVTSPLLAEPSFLTSADLDANGRVDLASVSSLSDEITILWNEPDGRFTEDVRHRAGDRPNYLAAVDLDRNGALDLVTADQGGNSISILTAEGRRSFQPPTQVTVGTGPRAVLAADIDDDGREDLLSANRLSQDVTLLFNRTGDPRFLRGDCDGDALPCSGVNDALALLSWLFLGSTEPPCLAACDPDGNGELELADAVYGLNFCFKGSDAPVAPFPACGVGTQSDSGLGCATPSCD